MFPKAQVAKKGGTKRDLGAEKEDKPEYIPETRLNQHPLTSGIRMHPVSGGSLFKNGINGMTFEEFQKEKLHQVESLGRPAHGLSEACQTFETSRSAFYRLSSKMRFWGMVWNKYANNLHRRQTCGVI